MVWGLGFGGSGSGFRAFGGSRVRLDNSFQGSEELFSAPRGLVESLYNIGALIISIGF